MTMSRTRKDKILLYFSLAAIISSIILILLLIWVSTLRTLTQLENTLFQVICTIIGFGGSYRFGKFIANEDKSLHARPAFRRILSLYKSLSRMAHETENSISDKNVDKKQALTIIKIMLVEEIATVDDAVNDWKDIIPEDVNEMTKGFRNNDQVRKND